MRCGAREIRFIDPTLNAHPAFAGILSRLGRLNRRKSVRFFAELNADRIGEREAALLAKAHFTEVEVGLQSRDPVVLRAIRRPTHLARLEAGVRAMARRGIRVTLDVMYGLPCQGLDDLRATLPWALGLRRVNVQCLRTLLLPGTELRARRRRWRLAAQPRPPYAVTASASLSGADLRAIEDLVAEHPRLRSDIPTRRFAGRSLPDLFPVRIHTSLHDLARTAARPCPGDRCAFLIHGADLFAHRPSIARAIRKLIRSEPDGLFQFVLVPEHEEPLDLLDHLIAVLRTGPPHLLDRYAALTRNGKLAARRVMVLQRPSHGLDPDWLDAADSLLAEHFA
jgi:hypothetical protein